MLAEVIHLPGLNRSGLFIEGRELSDELIHVPVGASDDTPDTRSLGELEGVIQRGLETFMEVGKALAAIRERKLYRERGFERFEDYCKSEWGFTRQHVNRTIAASRAVEEMEPRGSTSGEVETGTTVPKPQSERVARPLARIKDPEERREVWQEVQEEAETSEKPVTAAAVERKVGERLGKSENSKESTVGQMLREAAESGEAVELPDKELTLAERSGHQVRGQLRSIMRHDAGESASVHNNRIDPTRVEDEVRVAREFMQWLSEYIEILEEKQTLKVFNGGKSRVG